MYACRTTLCVAMALGGATFPCPRSFAADVGDLFRNPTFEELANARVTSVTRQPLAQFAAPAPAHVMTASDVRTSGSRSIPNALRFAPGMQVSQFDARTWTIAARGFASLFVDKLLVLVDGRSVYSPLWSGVYWEQHEWLDQDLDRIEVIRGPGGSAWGANAVNGVVNIVSKSARDTQGVALEVGGGTEERAFASARYGGEAGANGHYRVYADWKERDDSELSDGSPAGDAWTMRRGGVRYDHEDADARLMLKGEAYSGDFDEPLPEPSSTPPFVARMPDGSSSGGYLQTAWSRTLSENSAVRVDAWWEQYERRLRPSDEKSRTLNLDVEHRARFGEHALMAQIGYRRVDHEARNDFVFALTPAHSSLDVWSVSLLDEVALTPEVTLNAGVRFEHNDFVGWEEQPNVRVSWRPDAGQTFWAAVGHAVRTPSLANENGSVVLNVFPPGSFGPGSPAVIQQVIGNRKAVSEELLAREVGWRMQWARKAALGVAVFYNDYDRLITYAAQPLDTTTLAPEFWRVALMPVNVGSGRAYGAEFSALWTPRPPLRFDLELPYLELELHPEDDPLAAQLSGASPRWQASLRSHYELSERWQIGASLRYASRLEFFDVPAYVGADLRIAHRFGEGLELALVGRDLWSERHAEFRSITYPVDSFVERSVFVTLAWRM